MNFVVHISSLLLIQFSYELLMFSHKHRLYLFPHPYLLRLTVRAKPLPSPIACDVLPLRGIVVEVSPIWSLPADCRLVST